MKFFVLEEPRTDSPEALRGSTDAITEQSFNVGEATRCPRCNRPLTSLKWLPPYRIELETWGREYADVIPQGDDIIVSERFVQMFRNKGLRGLAEFDPVEVFKVKHRRGKIKQPILGYFKAAVSRSPTTIDQKASGYVWGNEFANCPVCLWGGKLKRFYRVVIKEDTWNGDDIFYARGGTRLMVSQRFKDAYEEQGLIGVIFLASETYGYEFCPNEREDWDVRVFDETLAVLQSENDAGALDHFVEAMKEIREQVVAEPKTEWIEILRKRFGRIDEVGDAAREAYHKLIRSP
jgi:hypothetical protein